MSKEDNNKIKELEITSEVSPTIENIFSSLSSNENGPDQIVSAWEKEIENLMNIDYTDLSIVLEAIANVTVDKLNVPEEQRQETVDFLVMYFENDPEMLDSVRDIFFKNRLIKEQTV